MLGVKLAKTNQMERTVAPTCLVPLANPRVFDREQNRIGATVVTATCLDDWTPSRAAR